MATDRLARLLADLEAQGIDAALLSAMQRELELWDPEAARVLRALADAATEPERAERCPTCGSDDPAVCNYHIQPHPHGSRTTPCCPHPWHDGGSR